MTARVLSCLRSWTRSCRATWRRRFAPEPPAVPYELTISAIYLTDLKPARSPVEAWCRQRDLRAQLNRERSAAWKRGETVA